MKEYIPRDTASFKILSFIKAYEELYKFEKEHKEMPRLSKYTQKLADWLITQQLVVVKE